MLLRRSKFAYMLTLPVAVTLLSLLIYPTIITLKNAFWGADGLTLSNFGSMASLDGFWAVVRNTLVFTIGSTVISMFLGFLFAYSLEFVTVGRRFFSSILIIPLAMMPVVSSLTFGMMLNPALGGRQFRVEDGGDRRPGLGNGNIDGACHGHDGRYLAVDAILLCHSACRLSFSAWRCHGGCPY